MPPPGAPHVGQVCLSFQSKSTSASCCCTARSTSWLWANAVRAAMRSDRNSGCSIVSHGSKGLRRRHHLTIRDCAPPASRETSATLAHTKTGGEWITLGSPTFAHERVKSLCATQNKVAVLVVLKHALRHLPTVANFALDELRNEVDVNAQAKSTCLADAVFGWEHVRLSARGDLVAKRMAGWTGSVKT